MDALDRTLVVTSILAVVAIVAGSPVPAAASVGLLVVAALLSVLPVVGGTRGARDLDSVRIVEGGTVTDRIHVEASVRAPMLATLRDRLPDIGAPKDRPGRTVTAFGRIDLTHDVPVELPVLGLARFGPAELVLTDPLALTQRRVRFGAPDVVRVWARSENLKEHMLRARYERMLAGRHPVRNPGASLNFYGIRKYLPTDPMRAVNWKATAGKGDMMVNQYEHETYGEVVLFIDARAVTGVGTVGDTAFHGVARAAASMAQAVYGQQDVLRAYTFGNPSARRFKMEPGSPWLDQFNDWLCETEPEGDQPVTGVFDEILPHLTPKSVIVFVSPLLGEDPVGDAVARSLALGNSVITLSPGVPEAVPEDLRQRLEDERAEMLDIVQDKGAPVLDLERTPSLDAALEQRTVVSR